MWLPGTIVVDDGVTHVVGDKEGVPQVELKEDMDDGIYTLDWEPITFTIKEKDGKFLLLSSTGKVIGTHDTKEEAIAQEAAISIRKAKAKVTAAEGTGGDTNEDEDSPPSPRLIYHQFAQARHPKGSSRGGQFASGKSGSKRKRLDAETRKIDVPRMTKAPSGQVVNIRGSGGVNITAGDSVTVRKGAAEFAGKSGKVRRVRIEKGAGLGVADIKIPGSKGLTTVFGFDLIKTTEEKSFAGARPFSGDNRVNLLSFAQARHPKGSSRGGQFAASKSGGTGPGPVAKSIAGTGAESIIASAKGSDRTHAREALKSKQRLSDNLEVADRIDRGVWPGGPKRAATFRRGSDKQKAEIAEATAKIKDAGVRKAISDFKPAPMSRKELPTKPSGRKKLSKKKGRPTSNPTNPNFKSTGKLLNMTPAQKELGRINRARKQGTKLSEVAMNLLSFAGNPFAKGKDKDKDKDKKSKANPFTKGSKKEKLLNLFKRKGIKKGVKDKLGEEGKGAVAKVGARPFNDESGINLLSFAQARHPKGSGRGGQFRKLAGGQADLLGTSDLSKAFPPGEAPRSAPPGRGIKSRAPGADVEQVGIRRAEGNKLGFTSEITQGGALQFKKKGGSSADIDALEETMNKTQRGVRWKATSRGSEASVPGKPADTAIVSFKTTPVKSGKVRKLGGSEAAFTKSRTPLGTI
jgi:hypothetical protein